MRVVKWSPQERVDVPDLTSMNFLVLGEFRRWTRTLVLGEDASTYVLQGFAVEPQAAPDSTIRVRLDPSGVGTPPFGAALGAENLGSSISHGQLMGNRDDAGDLEGNASQSLDFTAQPPATYTVQMRAVYADGANDNRAFWNPATNAEFIAAVDTRHLPLYELRLSGGVSSEWIDLADVVWDGVGPITVSEITDLRTFAFEGTTPWQQSSQPGSGGGAPEFDRSATRDTVGLNAVYPALRGLARQIQDIKGPDNSGMWNWWGRVHKQLDPDNLLAAGTTKSLRALDTVTYVIGDGTTTFGDFWGAGGLDLCLLILQTTADANRPKHVEILLRSHESTGFTWDWTTPYSIGAAGDPFSLTIRGEAGANLQRARVAVSVAAGNDALTFTNVSGGETVLRLEDVDFVESGGTVDRGLFSLNEGGIIAKRCTLVGGGQAGGGSRYLVDGGHINTRFEDCRLSGRIRLASAAASAADEEPGTVIDNCNMVDGVELDFTRTGSGAVVSRIQMRSSLLFGTGFAGNAPILDLGGTAQVRIEDCHFHGSGDQNMIHAAISDGNNPRDIRIQGCVFESDGAGGHAVGAGANGTNGTGWGIFVDDGFDIDIKDCRTQNEVVDAGLVHLRDCERWSVVDCSAEQCDNNNTASASFTGVQVTHSGALTHPEQGSIRGLKVGRWAANATTKIYRCVVLDQARGVSVSGCEFTGLDTVAAAVVLAAGSRGVLVDDCDDIRILGNDFKTWNSIGHVYLTNGSMEHIIVKHNSFSSSTSDVITTASVTSLTLSHFSNNTFVCTTDAVELSGATTLDYVAVNDNVIQGAGATSDMITWGTPSGSNNICMGNATNGEIQSGATTPLGYGDATANNTNGYV
jgi:hypothetical protein